MNIIKLMKFVTKTIIVVLYTYICIFSNISASEAGEAIELKAERGNYVEIRNFPLKLDLFWRAPNRDLDFHFRRLDGQEVYYGRKTNFNGLVQLLNDDTGANRHETMNLGRIPSGRFICYVYNYSNDAHLTRSQAEVKVTYNGRLIANPKIPTVDRDPSKRIWIVGLFEFDGSGAKFVPGNALTRDANGIGSFFNSIRINGGSSGTPAVRGQSGRQPVPKRPASTRPIPQAPRPPTQRRSGATGGNYVEIRDFPLKLDLSWSAPNRDLDFHFRRSDHQEVSYSRKTNFNGLVKLNKDDRGNDRHETITMNRIPSGRFILYVNNFSNDAHITRSQAEVKITYNGRIIANPKIPTIDRHPSKRIWIVGLFEFDGLGAKFVPGNALIKGNEIRGYFNRIHVINGSGPALLRGHSPIRYTTVSEPVPASFPIKNQEIKMELKWSLPNRDLDFYVRRSDSQQVNYSKKIGFGGKVELLKDDRGSARHETMMFHRINSGKFVLFVNNFSRDAHLSRSQAYVQIIIGGHVKETVRIPTNDTTPRNINWLVGLFDFDANRFTKINKLIGANSPEIFSRSRRSLKF